jgi:glycosyltransferase involved in cell wall biosynthesis
MDKSKGSIGQDNKMESVVSLPKVTICVPVRNGAQTIQRTLDSLLNQDYPNYEIIVSDNCSNDDTAQIVAEYESKGVKYFFNPVLEKWAESNWNHILSLAEGPFIVLYHADDFYTPTMVRRQVEFLLKHTEASAVFTMSQYIDEKDRPIKKGTSYLPTEIHGLELFDFGQFFNAVLKYGTFTPVPTMMTRREVIDKVGNFRWKKFFSASDIDLYLRMANQWGAIGIINEPLHRYRISPQQGGAQINRLRTFRSHGLTVMDYYLSMTEIRRIVQPDSMLRYEIRCALDDIKRAMNMTISGYHSEARQLMDNVYSRPSFKAGLRNTKYSMQFLLGIFYTLALWMGLGKIAAFLYKNLYESWRTRQKMQPLE